MFSPNISSALALGIISAATLAPMAQAANIKTLIQQKKDGKISTPLAPKNIPYTYIVSTDAKTGEGDNVVSYTAKYQVNPSAAPGSRLTFLGAPLETFPKDFREEMERLNTEATETEMAEEFWCASSEEDKDDSENDLEPEGITVIREDEIEAVISIHNDGLRKVMQMESGDGDMPKKVMKRLAMELTLAKPDLTMRNMKVWLTRPTTIKIVAKLKEMNIEQSCSIAANGIPYVSERKMKVSGKALGTSFMEDMVISVTDLQPL